jgi:2-(1,2-epoxy-1,2-dihydrophenyl)acetyl-CoA isomerase
MSADYETLEVSRGDGVLQVALNRPAEANALSIPLARELKLVVAEAESDPGCHVLVLSGNGTFFCAGGDVKGMAAAPDRVAFLHELAGTMHEVMLGLGNSRLVVVAVVDGPAAGAGLGLVLNADIVLITPRASFVSAYGKVGLTPDCGVSYLLPRVIGERRAAAVLLAGQPIDARQALEWGLANELCEVDAVEARVQELCARLTGGATQALGPTKRLLNGDLSPYANHLAAEAESIAGISAHPDSSARITAFAERSR